MHMHFTYTCPVEACHYTLKVKASNSETALAHIMKDYKSHLALSHPHMQVLSDQDMLKSVRTGMTEG